MKKLFIYLTYIVALLPIMSLFSLLILVPLAFPISLFPKSVLPIAPVYIVEIILVIMLGLYGLRLNKLVAKKTYKFFYWISLMVLIFVFLKSRLVVILQPLLAIIYSILFEESFQKMRKFLRKSIGAIAFLNGFDTILIIIFFILRDNIKYVEMVLSNFSDIFEEFHLSQKNFEATIITMGMLFLILLPLLRSCISVITYKKLNNISVSSGKVLWNSYLESYFGSAISVLMYFRLFFQIDSSSFSASTVFVLFIPMAISIYFWMWVYESINKGGDDKDSLILLYILYLSAIIFMVLLSMIESDLIEILTWFLPILLPNIIGNINKYRRPSKKPTEKMERHLYLLTVRSFNLLLIYNLLSVLSEKYNLKEGLNNIIQHNSKDISIFMSNLFSTLILMSISVIITFHISDKIIKWVEKYYLDSSNGFFY
ncbi:ABC transporter permease [Streptococcus sp. H31]|uniref:ABC transporter permease n=1 Tax=Streptococcus huangxiaojuni TaxID=3237239 RepID=UPI0034A5B109